MSVVEKATFEADGEAIFTLVNECYEVETGDSGVAFKLTPRMLDASQAGFLPQYRAGQVLKITSPDTGRLEGVIFYEEEPEKNSVYFGPFAVCKSCKGKGLGKMLIHAMEKAAKISMGDTLKFTRFVVVNHRTELISMYQHLGFIQLEGTKPYPNPANLSRPSHFIEFHRPLEL